MPDQLEASVVVGTPVHLLHKGDLRVDKSPWGQHSVDLIHHPHRIEHVLQNGLTNNRLKHPVRKRQIVCVTYGLGARPQRHVALNAVDAGILEQHVRAFSAAARSHNQDTGAFTVDCLGMDQLHQQSKILARAEIQRQRGQPAVEPLKQPTSG